MYFSYPSYIRFIPYFLHFSACIVIIIRSRCNTFFNSFQRDVINLSPSFYRPSVFSYHLDTLTCTHTHTYIHRHLHSSLTYTPLPSHIPTPPPTPTHLALLLYPHPQLLYAPPPPPFFFPCLPGISNQPFILSYVWLFLTGAWLYSLDVGVAGWSHRHRPGLASRYWYRRQPCHGKHIPTSPSHVGGEGMYFYLLSFTSLFTS